MSKNNFGIRIYYANLTPRIPIAFKGIASCRKGFKSDEIDSVCVRVTKISPIIREQFKMLHNNLITQCSQYKDFSYKVDAFDTMVTLLYMIRLMNVSNHSKEIEKSKGIFILSTVHYQRILNLITKL